MVVNGAGAAAIACTELIKAMGVRARPCHHVRPQGRDLQGPRPSSTSGSRRMRSRPTRARSPRRWSAPTSSSACRPPARSSRRWSRRWRKEPIIFAMANPDPEISPPDAKAARPDAIIATGRSDYPNQVNNVLGFPFIFRGALDVRATAINEEMKIAAADALAELAREPVPEEVAAAYGGTSAELRPRLHHPRAVRSAADGGRRRPRSPRRRWTRGVAQQADRGHGRLSAGSCARGSTRPTSVLSLAYESGARQSQARAVRGRRGG